MPPAVVLSEPEYGWFPVIRGTSVQPAEGVHWLGPVFPSSATGVLMGLTRDTYFRADDIKMIRREAMVVRSETRLMSVAQFSKFSELWTARSVQMRIDEMRAGLNTVEKETLMVRAFGFGEGIDIARSEEE